MWRCAATNESIGEVKLTDKIEPYVAPFLGILPLRHAGENKPQGVVVRYVYPDSPAAAVGLEPGDRLLSLDGEAIADADAMLEKMQPLRPATL